MFLNLVSNSQNSPSYENSTPNHFLSHYIDYSTGSDPPPDPFNEPIPMDKGYWVNLGQLTDPLGSPTSEAVYYSEGTYPVSFPINGSRISFTAHSSSMDSLTADTLFRWDIDFVGSGVQEVNPVGGSPSQDFRNFYFPHCGVTGITGVHRFGYVAYPDLYPGISLYLYQGAGGQKMAWVCEPGSNPQGIEMHFSELNDMIVAEDGSLQFPVLGQLIRFAMPMGYQFTGDSISTLQQDGYGYELAGNDVHFSVGQYDPSLPLVIFIGEDGRGQMAAESNEGLCWSTYFGGDHTEVAFGSTLGIKDDHYMAGDMTSAWATFPQSAGSHVPYNPAVRNAFVSRFSDLDELRWTTVFGGGYPTWTTAYDVAVKDNGDGYPTAYIVGYTTSNNFPVQSSGSAYYDGTGTAGVEQGIIFKVDLNGYRVWATYFGDQMTRINGIAKSGSKELVFTGITNALPHEQVTPPTGSTHLNFAGGAHDAFVAMLNSLDQYNWGTYYGGSGDESGMDIAGSPASKGVFYVTGWTTSANVTLVNKPSAYNAGYSGNQDFFILRFNPWCVLKWASCFGGPGGEGAWYESLEVDWVGDVYLVGTTESNPFPLQIPSDPNGFYDGTYGSRRGFVSRFNSTTQALEWSTFLGDGSTSGLYAVSSSKQLAGVFVGGAIGSGSAPLFAGYGYWYYQPFFYPNYNGPNTFYEDAYIARFDKHNVLSWSTYFGGIAHQPEYIFSLSCPKYSPSVLAYGTTNKDSNISSFFPLQASAWPLAYYDPTFNGGLYGESDCFITRFCSGAQPRPENMVASTTVQHFEGADLILREGSMYRVQGIATAGTLDVLTPLGQIVASIHLEPQGPVSQPFNLDDLPSGVYLLHFPGLPTQRISLVK